MQLLPPNMAPLVRENAASLLRNGQYCGFTSRKNDAHGRHQLSLQPYPHIFASVDADRTLTPSLEENKVLENPSSVIRMAVVTAVEPKSIRLFQRMGQSTPSRSATPNRLWRRTGIIADHRQNVGRSRLPRIYSAAASRVTRRSPCSSRMG